MAFDHQSTAGAYVQPQSEHPVKARQTSSTTNQHAHPYIPGLYLSLYVAVSNLGMDKCRMQVYANAAAPD